MTALESAVMARLPTLSAGAESTLGTGSATVLVCLNDANRVSALIVAGFGNNPPEERPPEFQIDRRDHRRAPLLFTT